MNEETKMSFSSIGWSQFGTEQQYPNYKFMELARAADFLARTVLEIKPGENVAIICDTGGDMRVVNATAAAIHTLGAHAVIILYRTSLDAQQAPPELVESAVLSADLCIDFCVTGNAFSKMYSKAREAGVGMSCLTGVVVDCMVRTFNPDNWDKIQDFKNAFTEILFNVKTGFKITSPAGTNLTIKPQPPGEKRRRSWGNRSAGTPGSAHMPILNESVNGTIVFDGMISPPCEIGIPSQPLELKVKDGVVTEISGGFETKIYRDWFAHFNDPEVYVVAHITPGANPNVKFVSGNINECERTFGVICIGIGVGKEVCAHTDGIILDPSIWVDDTLIEDEGIYVEPTLDKLVKKLGHQLTR